MFLCVRHVQTRVLYPRDTARSRAQRSGHSAQEQLFSEGSDLNLSSLVHPAGGLLTLRLNFSFRESTKKYNQGSMCFTCIILRPRW